MARHASTYRQARREAWVAHKATNPGISLSWEEYNQYAKLKIKGHADIVIGTRKSAYVSSTPKPSKYVPHIGAKQREKGAAK